MIYIRIELWPFGYRELAKLLGEAVICNDGTGSAAVGNYTASLSKRGGFGTSSILQHAKKLTKVWRRVSVKGLKRGRAGAVWDLVGMMVEAAREARG